MQARGRPGRTHRTGLGVFSQAAARGQAQELSAEALVMRRCLRTVERWALDCRQAASVSEKRGSRAG